MLHQESLYIFINLLINSFYTGFYKMFCIEPHALAKTVEHYYLTFLSCKSCIILFIVATGVLRLCNWFLHWWIFYFYQYFHFRKIWNCMHQFRIFVWCASFHVEVMINSFPYQLIMLVILQWQILVPCIS